MQGEYTSSILLGVLGTLMVNSHLAAFHVIALFWREGDAGCYDKHLTTLTFFMGG